LRVVFTDRELDVMTVLWEEGSATVSEVRARLTDRLAYTTVLTILRTLEQKGYVSHSGEGRAHRFHPLVNRDKAVASALPRMLETLFGGSAELLLTHLVRDRRLTKSELDNMRKLIDAQRSDRRAR
jgi:BlaI family transcriptional regulator, penicillinase repressor